MAETAVQDRQQELQVARACRLNSFDNDSRFNADDRNVGNPNNALRGIVLVIAEIFIMEKPRDLWIELCSYENLFLAYKKARKHKIKKDYVIEFEKNLEENLLLLRSELLLHSYKPKPLKTFIIRDPKTRKIRKSAFKDRVVHHALCNIIEPIFDKCFIYDSYANRMCKGTLKALQRFDYFKRKISRNNKGNCYILKADVKHYFETVEHEVLMNIIKKKVKDKNILFLIKSILKNYNSNVKEKGSAEQSFAGHSSQAQKGMPLGNLTSQFFANVYLNELDYFVKHKLKIKYYIRYVDDFVILNNRWEILEKYKKVINEYLISNLKLELHPCKSNIIQLRDGVIFLGYKVFYYCKLLRKSNKRKFERKFNEKLKLYEKELLSYEDFIKNLQGWFGYAMWADTYKLRKSIIKIVDDLLGDKQTEQLII